MISPYELLFQRRMLIYDVSESISYKFIVLILVVGPLNVQKNIFRPTKDIIPNI